MSAEKRANSNNVAVLELPRSSGERRFEATMGELVVGADSSELEGPKVRFLGTDGQEQVKMSQTTVSLASAKPGQIVVLMFINGDPDAPVITGLIQDQVKPSPPEVKRQRKIELDAQELLLSADSEITLKCGKSSLTLKRDGRVVIRGVHLLSRASSVNRIRGGSIQLN